MWIVTETQQGQEIEIWQTYSMQHACAILCDYSEQDKEDLSPCIYKRLSDGTLTTEY